jgi:hypothetical protein
MRKDVDLDKALNGPELLQSDLLDSNFDQLDNIEHLESTKHQK